MDVNKQSQTAGDNSQQLQAETIIINNGITEQRAREIYTEMSKTAIADNTAEAFEVANKRIDKFENYLISKVQQLEENFNSFSDPSFQVLLGKAQTTAACTDKEDDYEILSELLAHRIKNESDIKEKTSIEKAIEIINKIDDDALLGLTAFYTASRFSDLGYGYTVKQNDKSHKEVLNDLDKFYDILGVDKLKILGDRKLMRTTNSWIDNLYILGLISTHSGIVDTRTFSIDYIPLSIEIILDRQIKKLKYINYENIIKVYEWMSHIDIKLTSVGKLIAKINAERYWKEIL